MTVATPPVGNCVYLRVCVSGACIESVFERRGGLQGRCYESIWQEYWRSSVSQRTWSTAVCWQMTSCYHCRPYRGDVLWKLGCSMYRNDLLQNWGSLCVGTIHGDLLQKLGSDLSRGAGSVCARATCYEDWGPNKYEFLAEENNSWRVLIPRVFPHPHAYEIRHVSQINHCICYNRHITTVMFCICMLNFRKHGVCARRLWDYSTYYGPLPACISEPDPSRPVKNLTGSGEWVRPSVWPKISRTWTENVW